ncbi:Na+/H+ antiporter subunit E [Hoyosella altamirensis]|uniref:Multicomponent Na+:H+ antiporter subunit E n=1 Tax=Hoyosella altamirensis TaxID=616997 RepID=A0A839RMA1_9ACTN|nr:Na+/H+ antiporter subunit E [Hoyosella altamirensis]MBB3037865.1 multicomponent Na+:H+ antiporter subunit E [Hoyosella altamirensis]
MSTTLTWPFRALSFVLYYIWELTKSNIAVGWDIVTPGTRMSAGIVRLPLRCSTDLEITMLANLISLTPGTLTLSVQNNPAVLYVHGMYAADKDAFKAELYEAERRLLRAMRRDGEMGSTPSIAGTKKANSAGGAS